MATKQSAAKVKTASKPATKTTSAQTKATPKTAQAPKQAPAKSDAKTDASLFDQVGETLLAERLNMGHSETRTAQGETNFGLSKTNHPTLKLKGLTAEGAVAVYKSEYWDKSSCDELPPMTAVVMFDCAIDQGVVIAARLLQSALGVKVDGDIGPKTLKAAAKMDDGELSEALLAWRLHRYAHSPQSINHMRDWSRRVMALHRFLITDFTTN